jgi:hypothetical protein
MHLAFNLSRERFHRFINSTLRAKDNARLRLAFALQKLVSYLSAKPVGVGAASQPWIATGERSGLLTHTAMTESVSLCVLMKS